MQIVRDPFQYQPKTIKPLVLTLGNFDGVHLGHQKILKRVVESAKILNWIPAAFTFSNHPQSVLRPDLAPFTQIYSLEQKLFLLKQIGIEICFLISFTKEFAALEAEDFVPHILIEKLRMKKMCLGYNAHFGHERKGNPVLMKTLTGRLDFEFEEIGPVAVLEQVVSSSRVRTLLKDANLEEVKACLGRPYSVFGKVVSGDGRGKALGFPTANLDTGFECLLPAGVYPVEAVEWTFGPSADYMNAKTTGWHLKGVLNYGQRPTFGGKGPKLMEAHFLDYKGDLYGKNLEIIFHPKLRPEKHFQDSDGLKEQMGRDVQMARQFFR